MNLNKLNVLLISLVFIYLIINKINLLKVFWSYILKKEDWFDGIEDEVSQVGIILKSLLN